MIDDFEPSYRHAQHAPWHLLFDAFGVGLLVAAWFSNEPDSARWLFVGMATLFLLLGSSFRHLSVEDRGDHLEIRFGPVPLFRRRVRYDDLQRVELGKTTVLDGWGIHMSLRGGWVWNIWGRDCVVLHLNRSTLRVGTDDARNLASFLQSQISAR